MDIEIFWGDLYRHPPKIEVLKENLTGKGFDRKRKHIIFTCNIQITNVVSFTSLLCINSKKKLRRKIAPKKKGNLFGFLQH